MEAEKRCYSTVLISKIESELQHPVLYSLCKILMTRFEEREIHKRNLYLHIHRERYIEFYALLSNPKKFNMAKSYWGDLLLCFIML